MNYKSLCIGIIFCLAIANLYAQEPPPMQDSFTLDMIVISANKVKENTIKIAQQIKTLNATQITSQQAQNTADLLQNTGLASVQKSQQGGGSPVLRGFEANKILIVVDGIRMNNAIYRGGHLQNVLTIDNNALEKVEVLYGPSSTVYGSDALGGVLHLYSKKVKYSFDDKNLFKGGAMLRYGTVNNEKTANVNFNIGGSKWASFTSITASSFDDLIMGKRINPSYNKSFGERTYFTNRINNKDSLVLNPNKYKQVYSGYDQLDVIQKIGFRKSDYVEHGLNIQLSTSSDIPRYDRLTDPNPQTGLNQAEWYYGPQKRLLLAYDFNKRGESDQIGYHLSASYQAIEESRINRSFNSGKRTSRIENLDILGFNVDFNKQIGKHSMRFGADGQWNDVKSNAFITNILDNTTSKQSTRYPDGKNRFTQLGLYLSHTADLSSKLVINDGIRIGMTALHSTFISKEFYPFPYDEANQNYLTYSGNIGLNYLLGKRSKISGLIATGYRSPNIDDLAKVFESATTLIIPNPDLKPEQSINAEISTAIGFGSAATIQAAFYSTQLYDAIVVDSFQLNGEKTVEFNGNIVPIVAAQNKTKATISGFSTSISYSFKNGWIFDANVNYIIGKINDGKKTPLDHIPPLMLKSGLIYKKDRYSGGISVLYNSWKKIKDYNPNGEDNQQYATPEGMPSWFIFNLKMSYDLFDNMTLFGGVENIMDLQYRTFASGINAPGRNYYISAKASF